MHQKTTIRGVYTALVTPFNQAGKLDEQGLRKNIQFQVAHHCDGVVALGTTGESPTLTSKEKERIIQIVREESQNKCQLMVGTGCYSTAETIEKSKMAESMGADSLLVVTPYYNKPTQEGIYRHFTTLAEAVNIPIIVYNIQGRTGQNIQVDTLKKIAQHPRILGVKEASGNISQIGEVIEQIARQRKDFSVMCGDDSLTFPILALGGHGVICVLSNLVPQYLKKMVALMAEGQLEAAREIHYQLLPLFRSTALETNPIPIKAAMDLCGMAAGECRMPLCHLQEDNRIKLHHSLQAFNLIAK